MKTLILLILGASFGVVASLFAQTPPMPGPGVGGPGPWQDPRVVILGNVARGPMLQMPLEGRLPWGPRSYEAAGRFANFSFRAFAGTGMQTLVGGFVITGGRRIVLLRAIGPSLTGFGVTGILARPQLEVLNSRGERVALAVAWSETSEDTKFELRNAAGAVGAFALQEGSQDQVLLMLLDPGAYTYNITGADNSTGVVLIEGYDVPQQADFS